MLNLEADEALALCLRNHEEVSSSQLRKFRDLLMAQGLADTVDISGNSIGQALFDWYPNLFQREIRIEQEIEIPYCKRNERKYFEGDFLDLEFFDGLRKKGFDVGKILQLADYVYQA